MLRFASAGDMHIDDLRIALYSALLSRQRNEPLIVRIEDIDKNHYAEGQHKEVLQILTLFGIDYRDVIHQSNNLRFYRSMAIQLLQEKKAFNCFCTPGTLEQKRKASVANGTPYRYDDACTHLPDEATIDNENPFIVRLHRPGDAIDVDDLIRGSGQYTPSDIDSFVILSTEKLPTYNFACAVDDMLNDVSLVIRYDEHQSDTPRQVAIRAALGYDKQIKYAHLPRIMNHEGEKTSGGALRVTGLLEEGYLPEAIANYLISLGHATPNKIFTAAEAIEWFDVSAISKEPLCFDIEALRFINREHLKRLDDKELSRYVGFADEAIGRLAKIYLEDVSTTRELKAKIGAIFSTKEIPEVFAENADAIKAAMHKAPHFESFDELIAHLVKTTGIEGNQLMKTLSLLLVGDEYETRVTDIYQHLKNYLGEIIA